MTFWSIFVLLMFVLKWNMFFTSLYQSFFYFFFHLMFLFVLFLKQVWFFFWYVGCIKPIGHKAEKIIISSTAFPPNKIWSQIFKVSVVRIKSLTSAYWDERATKSIRRRHKKSTVLPPKSCLCSSAGSTYLDPSWLQPKWV